MTSLPPFTPPLGVGTTSASGLGLALNPLSGRTEAVGGMQVLLSKTLLADVCWRGAASALFSGVDLAGLASDSFLAWVESERRPAAHAASVAQ